MKNLGCQEPFVGTSSRVENRLIRRTVPDMLLRSPRKPQAWTPGLKKTASAGAARDA